jgi:uridine kinase
MNKDSVYLIGITGGSASGKTRTINQLEKIFGDDIVVISQDNYYKNLEELGKERWDRADYDTPAAFNNNELANDLKKLIKGESVAIPIYDFKTHSRKEEEMQVDPAHVIIIEGLFIYNVPEIRDLLDYKVFLHADGDIRLSRRLLRDINERGQSVKNIAQSIQWYLETVKPKQEKYIIPMEKYADKVINVNSGTRGAVEFLEGKIRNVLKNRKNRA